MISYLFVYICIGMFVSGLYVCICVYKGFDFVRSISNVYK